MVFQKLNLHPGEHMKILGDIPPDAKHFGLNLGKDKINLALYFNSRFSAYGHINLIYCNSLEVGTWGQEEKEIHFPFVPGSRVEIGITFEGSHFTIRLPEGFQFNFPNRLILDKMCFFGIIGDFRLKIVDFE
ncbi:galectin-1-like [Dromiciops gliroides]|uniref:galectin-1-like n=1 Tax=Dromiciops gliroides TaxID=33562 RepID=UPI001CC552F3|nr:galectin-1-like [Dromiciops gliroides]